MTDDIDNIQIQRIVPETEARVMVTWQGQTGDLPDTVSVDSSDVDVKRVVSESIRTGYIPGITADPAVDLADFVIDRHRASDTVPYARISIRPKVPFGCEHCYHEMKYIMMVVRPGHVPEQCCKCQGIRQRHVGW